MLQNFGSHHIIYFKTLLDENELLMDYDFEIIQQSIEAPLCVLKEVRASNFQPFIKDLSEFLEI